MTDRDTFAAAALTGLLTRRDCYDHELAILAYDMADAMLRERFRAGQKMAESDSFCAACPERESTNHDAAPAARADSTDDRTDKAAPSQRRDGTGSTWFPLWNPKPGEILPKAVIGLAYDEYLREPVTKMGDGKTAWKDLPKIRPLPNDAAPTAGDDGSHPEDERVRASAAFIGNTQEPVAWMGRAARTDGGDLTVLRLNRKDAESDVHDAETCEPREIVPLYRRQPPALTKQERDAVRCAISVVGEERWIAAIGFEELLTTLQQLLERTK